MTPSKAPPFLLTSKKSFRFTWAIASLLIFIYMGVSIHAIQHLSPTWDEIAYPAAGLAQLKTGHLNLNTVNPFLSKLIYAGPLLFSSATLPFDDPSWDRRNEYRFGYIFTYKNKISPYHLHLLTRLPLVILGVFIGVFLFRWLLSLWGSTGALFGLLGLFTTPIFLARSSVAQLEMPLYLFILLSLWFHVTWVRNPKVIFLVASGIFMGLAALCKLIMLPLIPSYAVIHFLFPPTRTSFLKRFYSLLILILSMVVTVVCGYGLWKEGMTALQSTLQNLIHFDTILPYYWAGRTYDNAPSLVSWAAYFIKAPLHILVLGSWGAWAWWRSQKNKPELIHFGLFVGFTGLSVLFFKNAVSTVQFSPSYLGLVMLMGGVATLWSQGIRQKCWLTLIFLFGAVDVATVHPNYGSYFNRLVGGSNQGWKWLADSDQDWGQSLPLLSNYLQKEAPASVFLCYSGSGDPRAYGIEYNDLLSPALVTRDKGNERLSLTSGKMLLVVGTKVIQSEPTLMGWLQENIVPIHMVAQTFFVYDITQRWDVMEWMTDIYRSTRRTEQADQLINFIGESKKPST